MTWGRRIEEEMQGTGQTKKKRKKEGKIRMVRGTRCIKSKSYSQGCQIV